MFPDMAKPNTPNKTLNSWKQIAAYLDCSERTVRRWESAEGLPVHRHGHNKQDTVVAHKHELDAWCRSRTRSPVHLTSTEPDASTSGAQPINGYLAGARCDYACS